MIDQVFFVAIIVFSVIIHELMHGLAADWLGDRTARYAGRLTLNPIASIDPIGSILVPIISSFAGFGFGWAKPVPYNPYNFTKFREHGEAIVAAAGPLSNLAIALIFGLLIRLGVPDSFAAICFMIVIINISLFILNLIPIPPLDGSKILSVLLPGDLNRGYMQFRYFLESNFVIGIFAVIILVNVFGSTFGTLVRGLSYAIVGA
jgi:Zn-dependent protease